MARSSECTEQHAQKVIDTADIVREAMLRQLICVNRQALSTGPHPKEGSESQLMPNA
jgi:hypothetical protein